MHYIETLREGERVNEIYLCKNRMKQKQNLFCFMGVFWHLSMHFA